MKNLTRILLLALAGLTFTAHAEDDGAVHHGTGVPVGGVDSSGNFQVLSVTTGGGLSMGTGTSANQVQGTAADGAAAVGNPVQIGGKDGSGNVQTLLTNTDGSLQVGFTTVDPCQSSGVAKSSVVLNHTATAELVAISGTTVVYVCGFSISLAGTAPTFRFQTGTGTTCGTGTVQQTGVYTPASAAPFSTYGAGTIFKGTAGQALCINLGGTTPSAQGVLTYVQQ